MTALPLPLFLAALGLALVAFAIFAPQRVTAAPAVSLAPPIAPPALTWSPSPLLESFVAASEEVEPEPLLAPRWPRLIDPLAADCDPPARAALVDALVTVATPWGHDVLLRAQMEETDPLVRSALDEALASAGLHGEL
jgi:hypothetical protein